MEFLSTLTVSSTTLLTLIVLVVTCLVAGYMTYYFIKTIYKAHKQDAVSHTIE